MQFIKCDFNHPFIQFKLKITQPFLDTFKSIIIDNVPAEVTSFFLQALLFTSIKHPIATLLKFETFPLRFNYTDILIIGIITLKNSFGYLVL